MLAEAVFSVQDVGLMGVIVATWAIYTNRKIAKQKNTIDLIAKIRENDTLRSDLEWLRTVDSDSSVSIEQFAKDMKANQEACKKILSVLNLYEAISIGIRDGLYDEKVFIDYGRTTLIHVYQKSKPFITRLRKDTNNDKYFEHLQFVAKKFEQLK